MFSDRPQILPLALAFGHLTYSSQREAAELILPLSVRQTSLCARLSDALIGLPASVRQFIGQSHWAAVQRGSRAVSDSPAAMASYFDEHDCEPLDSEQQARTNMLLELARWVRGAGRWGPRQRVSGLGLAGVG